ncbi:MAG: hypothetical protein K1X53_00660 [Candidatus Sumerlaeaceae bacterium]|nr:hypothetical protein [Candidatus Sumerlaeaceae bacterium]
MSSASTHYLYRNPGLALPLVALVVNLAVIMFMLQEMRASRSRVRAAFAPVGAVVAGDSKTPLLEVFSAEEFRLEGEPIRSTEDLEFRLGGRASSGPTIRVATAPAVDAQTLARVLRACGQAGFTNAAVELAPRDPGIK